MNTKKLKEDVGDIGIDSPCYTLDALIKYKNFLTERSESNSDFADPARIDRLNIAIRAVGDSIILKTESLYEHINEEWAEYPDYTHNMKELNAKKEWDVEFEKPSTRHETILARNMEEAMKIATRRAEDGETVNNVEPF